ncbi:MAG: hypothetical protein WCG05_00135 [Alphaproteobacteria bacterium]
MRKFSLFTPVLLGFLGLIATESVKGAEREPDESPSSPYRESFKPPYPFLELPPSTFAGNSYLNPELLDANLDKFLDMFPGEFAAQASSNSQNPFFFDDKFDSAPDFSLAGDSGFTAFLDTLKASADFSHLTSSKGEKARGKDLEHCWKMLKEKPEVASPVSEKPRGKYPDYCKKMAKKNPELAGPVSEEYPKPGIQKVLEQEQEQEQEQEMDYDNFESSFQTALKEHTQRFLSFEDNMEVSKTKEFLKKWVKNFSKLYISPIDQASREMAIHVLERSIDKNQIPFESFVKKCQSEFHLYSMYYQKTQKKHKTEKKEKPLSEQKTALIENLMEFKKKYQEHDGSITEHYCNLATNALIKLIKERKITSENFKKECKREFQIRSKDCRNNKMRRKERVEKRKAEIDSADAD